LRLRFLGILVISACFLSGASAFSSSVEVRYREGLVHGFLVLSTLDGTLIAAGDLTQVAHGNRVTNQLVFRFKDGSRQEETTVFSQRDNFRLVSYHLVQKGPAFKNASDLLVTCATGQVTVRYTDGDGKEKVVNEHLALPPDNADPGGHQSWTLRRSMTQTLLADLVITPDTGMAWAEDPPSRTRHLIGNLEAAPLENGEVQARTAFLVYRSHLETDHQLLSGCREDCLRKVNGAWKVARRTIVLDANVLLDKNLSVFL